MLQNPCEALDEICHSHLGSVHRSKYTRKLEMLQRRSARMVCSDYRRTSSVSSMLQQLQWPTLQERRAQAKATMMYRIVCQLEKECACASEWRSCFSGDILGHFCCCFLLFLLFCFVLLFFFSLKFQIRTPWRNDRMRSCQ